ncbi:prepilin peptidase [Paenibacillus sp. YYML68]|uniref:A24 family peptidase n=1 Tax=Paenibacillus sp. YYML68 TaxID=2909250 RepID=UPI0024911AAC|nr:prepilin peptidase [Paenibacillus sp. YYML68]
MWQDTVLIVVLIICVVTDIRSRKIYNKVIFPTLVLAVSLHAVHGGWHGLGHSLTGFAVGLGVLLLPYMLGGMGAGDVKLLALVGALKGAMFVLTASVYMALVGAVMALVIVLFKDGFMTRLRFIGYIVVCLRHRMKPQLKGSFSSGTYPYGVAIACGCVASLWLKGWGAG